MERLCKNCEETFEPGFDVCWNCGADQNGNLSKDFVRPEDQPEDSRGFLNALDLAGRMTGTFKIQNRGENPANKSSGSNSSCTIALLIGIALLICGNSIQDSVVTGIGVLALGFAALKFFAFRLGVD